MTYTGKTPLFEIPSIKAGEVLSEDSERDAVLIIENQLRAGILGAGSTRVFVEGTYSTANGPGNVVSVTLTGSPSLQGIARQGLVEFFGAFTWINLLPGRSYTLYAKATPATYLNPSDIEAVASETVISTSDHLLLATLDNTIAGAPVLDISPAGKPIGANLFDLLNSPVNPFGASLTQQNLTALLAFGVTLAQSGSALFDQSNADAVVPVIRIVNASAQPEISSDGELRFNDVRTGTPPPLSNTGFTALPLGAGSLLDALNRLSSGRFRRTGTATDLQSTNETVIGVTDTSVPRTVTISSADIAKEGRFIFVKDESDGAGTNNITIATEGAETIEGASTAVINTDGGSKVMYADGSNLFLLPAPITASAAYTRNAAIVEDRTLLASASATIINNNNVLAALIADLQTNKILG